MDGVLLSVVKSSSGLAKFYYCGRVAGRGRGGTGDGEIRQKDQKIRKMKKGAEKRRRPWRNAGRSQFTRIPAPTPTSFM
jgi:hypothetical protein